MKIHRFFLPSLILIIVFNNCTQKQENTSNRIDFSIPQEERKIIVPVNLNDSIPVKFVFDTGGGVALIIDSSVLIAHPNLFGDVIPFKFKSGSAWGSQNENALAYRKEQSVGIGNTQFKYDWTEVFAWKKHMNNDLSDGLFNIPQTDSIHVWELNFESNYMEIHPADQFKMPENTMLFPLLKIYPDYRSIDIQLPLRIRCANGDTLTMNKPFFIDTGMGWDIAVKDPAEELTFFGQQTDAVWTHFLDKYTRYYTVNATLGDHFTMDSLRIYTFDYKDNVRTQHVLGLNFLKRFNVFFDLKNKQVGLQPIKNFQRVVNPLPIRFYYSVQTSNGKYVINKMADYKGNYYQEAGLQEGDELVKVNGMPYGEVCHAVYRADLSQEMKDAWKNREFVIFDIIRNGKPMQIPVKINYNEQQGD